MIKEVDIKDTNPFARRIEYIDNNMEFVKENYLK